jgi:hypothetical protein
LAGLKHLPGRLCVIADVPHAGALLDDARSVPFTAGREPLLLAACTAGQVPFATADTRLGVFTQALVRALEGQDRKADRNGDGFLDTQELADSIRVRVAELARRAGPFGKPLPQTPVLSLPRGRAWPLVSLKTNDAPEENTLEEEKPER